MSDMAVNSSFGQQCPESLYDPYPGNHRRLGDRSDVTRHSNGSLKSEDSVNDDNSSACKCERRHSGSCFNGQTLGFHSCLYQDEVDFEKCYIPGSSVDMNSCNTVDIPGTRAERWGSSDDSSPNSQTQPQTIAKSSESSLFKNENGKFLSENHENSELLKSEFTNEIKSETVSPNDVSSTNPHLDFWSKITSTDDFQLESASEADLEMSSSSPHDWKQNALRYPPCVVCTGKSSGLHYGCYTCEACKNFFRRYLLRNGGFSCKKNNKCVISNRSRGNCSGCRLKKCLEVGMSKEKSKIGRYTHSQRTETIREVNKLEGKAYADEINIKKEIDLEEFNVVESLTCFEKPQIVSGSHVTSGEDTLTEEETGIVNTLIEMMDAIEHFGERGKTPEGREQIINEHYERYIAKVKLIGPLKAIPKEEYFTLLKLYNIDLDGRWNLFKQEANNCAHIVEKYCKFAYTIPGFQTISLKDQETLLKIGHCDFFIMLLHEGYDHERQIFLEMNGVPAHVEEAADKIFSRDLIEQQCKLYRKWQQANLLKEEQALLCAMSLLCSDRVELENPEPVEKIHSDLTAILMKVLKKHHGKNAEKRFSKFIDNLTLCRQGSEMYFKEYQEMSNDNMVQQAAPAFPTLCPDNF